MPDLGYDAGGLRVGASAHLNVAATVEQLVAALSRTALTPVTFGRVGAAARLAAALDHAQQVQGRSAAAESAARADLGRRVGTAAGLGVGLTASTASIAATGRGSIVAGMSG